VREALKNYKRNQYGLVAGVRRWHLDAADLFWSASVEEIGLKQEDVDQYFTGTGSRSRAWALMAAREAK